MSNSSLLDRYDKLLLEKTELQLKLNNFKEAIETCNIDEETRKLLQEIISPPLEKNKPKSNEETIDNRTQRIIVVNTPTGRVCPRCEKWKPIAQFQTQRSGLYIYTYPPYSKCGYCRRFSHKQ